MSAIATELAGSAAASETVGPSHLLHATMTHSERAAITISVMLAGVLQSLDTTIANVALPHIRGSLSATSEQMGWVLPSYIIASAIMTPLSGWLAKRYGRRNVMLCSIVGF